MLQMSKLINSKCAHLSTLYNRKENKKLHSRGASERGQHWIPKIVPDAQTWLLDFRPTELSWLTFSECPPPFRWPSSCSCWSGPGSSWAIWPNSTLQSIPTKYAAQTAPLRFGWCLLRTWFRLFETARFFYSCPRTWFRPKARRVNRFPLSYSYCCCLCARW